MGVTTSLGSSWRTISVAGKSSGRRGPMDPDTYQKRDVKRRLSASEKAILRLEARISRLSSAFDRKILSLLGEIRSYGSSEE